MATTIVQVRVDETLKKDVAELYESMGIDLSTAVRIFFKKSLQENGIPFSMKQNEIPKKNNSGIEALMLLRKQAEKNNLTSLSLDDINAEIRSTRKKIH